MQSFQWDGQVHELAPGLTVNRFTTFPDVAGMEQHLSKVEHDRAANASHWLVYEVDETVTVSIVEITNLVLISLWLVRPTRTHIQFRFVVDAAAQGPHRVSRVLERFSWIEDTAATHYSTDDLIEASRLFLSLNRILENRGRLADALVLTTIGCWSHGWQVSLICHAAAIEALLTYAQGGGLARRLASTFACLTEIEVANRNLAYLEFWELYAARSDVMHGRMFNVPQGQRLNILDRIQTILRRLWRRIALDPVEIAALEGNDDLRRQYFSPLENGFNAPPPP